MLTGTVGVDGAWDRLLAGLAVAHSRGDGSFTKPGTADRGRGELENTLTSVHPYLRYAVNDRLDVWSVLGYGRGHMEMEVATGETMETDMALVMGAFGGPGHSAAGRRDRGLRAGHADGCHAHAHVFGRGGGHGIGRTRRHTGCGWSWKARGGLRGPKAGA